MSMLISEKATFFAQSYGKKSIPLAGMGTAYRIFGRRMFGTRYIDFFFAENYTDTNHQLKCATHIFIAIP